MMRMETGGRRLVLGVAAAVGLVALGALTPLRERLIGTPLERARSAHARDDMAGAIRLADLQLARDPGNSLALKLKTSGLIRLGRIDEALVIGRRIGADKLEADDLFLIGRSLAARSLPAHAWIAYEAASRLDRKHPGTIKALADMQASLTALRASVGPLDRVAAVPDATAFAELALGMATLTPDPKANGGFDPILDRLLQRPRAEFARLSDAAASRKLLARIMLEEGRPGEARKCLEGAANGQSDPEAQWLLSRAYLADGKFDRAVEALDRAGDFGADLPMAPDPSTYVGAKTCAKCHTSIYESQQGSHHAMTIAGGDDLANVKLPDGPLKDPADPKIVHRFDRKGAEIRISVGSGDDTVRAFVDYALGSGHHGVTMIAKDDSGVHRSLRMSYYPGGPAWEVTGGSNPHPVGHEQFLGDSLSDRNVRECLNCHTTRFTSEHDRKGPEAADRGIGCERCHGPGQNHLRAVEEGFPQLAIARPKLATPAQRMTLCAECHSANGGIPPSDPRFIRFQSTTLAYSRCSTESGGKLDCVACHDPHRNAETSASYYEARCRACHGSEPEGKEGAPSLRLERVAAAKCSVNAAGGCLDCHMPKVDKVMPNSVFTDHHIRIHRPAEKSGAERASASIGKGG